MFSLLLNLIIMLVSYFCSKWHYCLPSLGFDKRCNLNIYMYGSLALSRVQNFLTSGDIMREESLRHASDPCVPLESKFLDEELYRVESTGAIVFLTSSVGLIYFYCSRLPSDGSVISFESHVAVGVDIFPLCLLRSFLVDD